MSELFVKSEILADGLKRGISKTSTIFSSLADRDKLRGSPCGLVSSAIHQYLVSSGLRSRLLISTPELTCDPTMQHVFPVVSCPSGKEIVIDASYSQFLGFVGLSYSYEECTNSKEFPKEEIIDFPLAASGIVAEWLTSVAVRFQRKNSHPINKWGIDAGGGPLEPAHHTVIYDSYSRIWSSANVTEWSPPDYVIADGFQVAQHIPKESIVIV